MAGEDGRVIIATLLDTNGVKQGTVELEKELLGLGDSAEKANDSIGGKLASGFKKLGAAIAAAGIVDALVDFGKEAVALGSDLEEVQNVVDVTFETMSDSVNKFARDAQKSAGLSEQMAKQYVGTFGAMADSFGFTEQEAYEMSTALTQLTGDVASFYNLSQDEAATKLKGVFTGETEALKELGVVMTQAALDNYALANGFDKTTSSMTEQEKVALRYQFVMDQLSAASGDFVRTQDSWANQSKVLSLQWESLMATLGTGLIDVLTPGIEFLNNKVLPALQKFADKFAKAMEPTPAKELSRSLSSFEGTLESANSTLEESAQEIEFNAILAERYKDRLSELESTGLDTAEAQREYANVVGWLNELFPELNLQISQQTGMLDANSRAQLGNIEAIQQKYFLLALEEQYNAVLTAQGQLQAQLYIAEARLQQIQYQRDTIMQQLSQSTGVATEELISHYWAIQNAGGAMTDAEGNVISLTEAEQALYAELFNLNTELGDTQATIDETTAAIAEQEGEVAELTDAYNSASSAAGDLGDSQGNVSEAVANTAKAVANLKAEYDSAVESARSSVDSQIGLFEELSVESGLSTDDIVSNWKSQQKAIEDYKSNLQTLIDRGYAADFVAQVADGTTEMMGMAANVVADTTTNVDEFNAEWERTKEARETLAEVVGGMSSDLSGKFSDMHTSVSTAWEDMDAATQEACLSMMEAINSLEGKTIYITTKYQTVGKPSGHQAVTNTPVPFSVQGTIPYLASGAVIPPNAPFLAVLGDQRRGTNIEAPLSTIQEAVREEMGDMVSGMMAGFQALLEEQRATRKTIENIEVGDTVIGEAADRYRRELDIMTGGAL